MSVLSRHGTQDQMNELFNRYGVETEINLYSYASIKHDIRLKRRQLISITISRSMSVATACWPVRGPLSPMHGAPLKPGRQCNTAAPATQSFETVAKN
jgi:hypothetical protein